jgi:hypothetical protein
MVNGRLDEESYALGIVWLHNKSGESYFISVTTRRCEVKISFFLFIARYLYLYLFPSFREIRHALF